MFCNNTNRMICSFSLEIESLKCLTKSLKSHEIRMISMKSNDFEIFFEVPHPSSNLWCQISRLKDNIMRLRSFRLLVFILFTGNTFQGLAQGTFLIFNEHIKCILLVSLQPNKVSRSAITGGTYNRNMDKQLARKLAFPQ